MMQYPCASVVECCIGEFMHISRMLAGSYRETRAIRCGRAVRASEYNNFVTQEKQCINVV